MGIAKIFKGIINKFNKPKSLAASRWPELLEMQYHIKEPANMMIISARVTVTNDSVGYPPKDYVKRKMAELIAQELIDKDLIAIEQTRSTNSDERVYVGRIEVVARR